MKYFAKCNSVFNRTSVELVGEDELTYFTIKHAKLPKIYGLTFTDVINNKTYKVNYNPLKFKKRFQLLDEAKKQIMAISVGIKYLHRIEYNNKVFSCKGSIWKIRYKLYDRDNVVASIKVVKIEGERYYQIDLADNKNIMIAIGTLVVAQSIRERLFVI